MCLVDNRTEELLSPDFTTGYLSVAPVRKLALCFTVYTGWDNFERVFTDPGIQGPFLKIFSWTVIFALLTVLVTSVIGLLMACLVQWEHSKEMVSTGYY